MVWAGVCALACGSLLAAAQNNSGSGAGALAGDAAQGRRLASTECAACHGQAGVSTSEGVPSLAGQHANYTAAQLRLYKEGTRKYPLMNQVAKRLSTQDIANLAAYYQAQKLGHPWGADAAARARGQKLFQQGEAARGIGACASCHAADGRGKANRGFPSVARQSPSYTADALQKFHDAPPSKSELYEMMRKAAQPLTKRDMQDLAAYLGSMKP